MTKKKKIKDLQKQIERRFRTIEGPGGERIIYRPHEELGALAAAIDGEDHRLLPAFRQHADKGPVGGVADIINAIEHSIAKSRRSR